MFLFPFVKEAQQTEPPNRFVELFYLKGVNDVEITINIKKRVASVATEKAFIVCGNSDYKIKFVFDDKWKAAGQKTARFIYGNKYYEDVAIIDDVCTAPIITNAREVRIGVYAGKLATTTPARIECKKSIICDSVAGEEKSPVVMLKGDKGEKGDKGDKGDRGETGATGETGADGARGKDGASAYEIAVKNGFDGTEQEWLESLKPKETLITIEVNNDHVDTIIHTENANVITVETNKLPTNARVRKIEIPDVVNGTNEYISLENMIDVDPLGVTTPYYTMFPKNLQGNYSTIAALVYFTIMPNSFYEAISAFTFYDAIIKIHYIVEE